MASSSSTPALGSRSPHPEHPLLVVGNERLLNKCRAFIEQLKAGAAPWIVQRLNNSYGGMPADAPSFIFWVALVRFIRIRSWGGSSLDSFRQVLPIDEYEKAKLLPIRSLRLRLKLVAHWVDQLTGTW